GPQPRLRRRLRPPALPPRPTDPATLTVSEGVGDRSAAHTLRDTESLYASSSPFTARMPRSICASSGLPPYARRGGRQPLAGFTTKRLGRMGVPRGPLAR